MKRARIRIHLVVISACLIPFSCSESHVAGTRPQSRHSPSLEVDLSIEPVVNHHPVVNDPEEYAVYSALINASYVGKDTTCLTISNIASYFISKEFRIGYDTYLDNDHYAAFFTQVKPETFNDFNTKSLQDCLLKRRFRLKCNYDLLSDQEAHEIEKRSKFGNFWVEYNERYPKWKGLISLSRVGFDRARKQALVNVGTNVYPTGGVGGFYLLEKEKGRWKIKAGIFDWES